VLLGPMIMRGCMAGSNHLNTFSIEDSTKDTHPAVAPDPLTWRKIPPPLVTSAGVVVRCSLATGSQCTFCGQVVGDDRGVFVLGGVGGQPSASEVRQYAKLEWYGWRMFSVFGSQGSYTQ
jgi:hypothetical protein